MLILFYNQGSAGLWPLLGDRPIMETVMRRSILLAILGMVLVSSTLPAQANPRLSGRIVRMLVARRWIAVELTDGRTIHAILESDAELRRSNVVAQFSHFHVGDYVVVEIAGPLNDDPLDCNAMFDYVTAGKAPKPAGSVDTSIQGSHLTNAGTVAPKHSVPRPEVVGAPPEKEEKEKPKAKVPGLTGQWNPTVPWSNVPSEAGPSMDPPRYEGPNLPKDTKAPGIPTMPEPVIVNPNWPVASTSGTKTPANADPAPGTSAGTVSLQGVITEVHAAQSAFVMRVSISGGTKTLRVTVSPHTELSRAGSGSALKLASVRVGDYVMLTGVHASSGAVIAYKVCVR